MKLLAAVTFLILFHFHASAAISLEASDENSILTESDSAMKDIGKPEKRSPAPNATTAYLAGKYDEAIRLARPLAETGDADAIYLMGFAHETGNGLPQSNEKAMEYYRKAAAKNHADSIYRLSFLLLASGQEVDVREAQGLLEKQAKMDSGVSGRILGEAFLRGVLTGSPDADSAVKWWTKAAGAGDVPSMVFLARFYEGQRGLPERKNDALAVKYYEEAAAKGDTGSMIKLGSRLLIGDPKLRDEKKGKEWITKALAGKDPSGHLALGAYLQNVKNDSKAALAEYEKGAEAGHIDCTLRAGTMFIKGEGTGKDSAKGAALLEKAAEAGSTQAHLELAAMMMNLEKPDITAGYAHLTSAANTGLPLAQNELGLFYLSGKLGVADVSAAVSWFDRAAQANFPDAQNNLAALYERGAGVPQSYGNATKLYTLASQQGHASATLALARFQATGATTKQNPELAWAFAKIAVERGEENAAGFIVELEKNFTKEQLAQAKKELERLESVKKP